MITLILKSQNTGGGGTSYYFSNPKTQSENELFDTKLEGIKLLFEYLLSKLISAENANTLFDEVIALSIHYGKKEESQFVGDFRAMVHIKILKTSFEKMELVALEGKDSLGVLYVYPREERAFLISGRFATKDFFSQKEAMKLLEELREIGILKIGEYDILYQHIKDSSLPYNGIKEKEALN